MNDYHAFAQELQTSVIASESDQLAQGYADYTKERERQAIVHTRQDLVLLLSYALSLNGQLATVRRLLWVIAALLVTMLIWRP